MKKKIAQYILEKWTKKRPKKVSDFIEKFGH